MARIIEGTRKNLVGEKVKMLRKEKISASSSYLIDWKLWPYTFAAGLSPGSKTEAVR